MKSILGSILIMLLAGCCIECLAWSGGKPTFPDNGVTCDTARFNRLVREAQGLLYHYPDSALIRLTEALEHSECPRSKKGPAISAAGLAHYVKGEYYDALRLFTEARHIYQETGDHYGLSSCYNHIGLIYQTQQRYDRAIKFHRKGVSHAKLIDNFDRQAANHFNIGLAYDEQKQYDSALHYLRICLDESLAIQHHRMILMSFNRMAKIHFHLNDYAAARILYDSALNYKSYQNNWETCFSLAGKAEVCDAQGLHDEAIRLGTQSLELAKEIKAKWDIVHVSEILSRAYANKKNFEKAYQTSLLMQAYKDSLFSKEKESNLNYLLLKENELAQAKLEKENAMKSAKLERRNLQIATAIAFAVAMLVIILVLYARHRQKSRLASQLIVSKQQVERQNQELNELNRAKNQLLSIISHDMRSPFANLQGLLSLARSGNLNEDEQAKLFAQLERSFSSVSDTLDSLLQWTQIQIEGLKTVPERVRVDDLVEKTRGFWEPAITQKTLTCKWTPHGHEVYADRYQLKTVIRNILGNAIKFTQPNGLISIDSVQRNGKVGIIINDTGIGMSSEIRDSLFDLQKRNQRPGTLMEKGSGLGLLLSLELLEKNGGSLEVVSEEGIGTTFTVWVPSA